MVSFPIDAPNLPPVQLSEKAFNIVAVNDSRLETDHTPWGMYRVFQILKLEDESNPFIKAIRFKIDWLSPGEFYIVPGVVTGADVLVLRTV